jgi:pimeloyl-ACP methyl ester carboxylesterase
VPTLVLWGRQDALIAAEDAQRFGQDIPTSRVIVYEGVGHVPMEEVATRSAADAKQFLLDESVQR